MASFIRRLQNFSDRVRNVALAELNKPGVDAAIAACVFVGRADGEFDADEKKTLASALTSLEAFKGRDLASLAAQIEEVDRHASTSGALGEMILMEKIEKMRGGSLAATVHRVAELVASADGTIDMKERAALDKIKHALGL